MLAERKGKSLAALALEWVLSRPGIASVLIGAREPSQIDQALEAVGTANGLDWSKMFEV